MSKHTTETALPLAAEIDRLREVNAELLEALQKIADGEVMGGKWRETQHNWADWSHAETVHEYQRLCRAAIAKATGAV